MKASLVSTEVTPETILAWLKSYKSAIPKFLGKKPRITMATFNGYSLDQPDVFVWS